MASRLVDREAFTKDLRVYESGDSLYCSRLLVNSLLAVSSV